MGNVALGLFVVKGLPRRGDLELPGARPLEGLNLRVDSQAKKLVAGGPIPAAARKVVQAVPVPRVCWWTEQGGGGIIMAWRKRFVCICGTGLVL